MNKITYAILAISLISSCSFAQIVSCPGQIYCNYKDGTCKNIDKATWKIFKNTGTFEVKTDEFSLKSISAKRVDRRYSMWCYYGKNGDFMLNAPYIDKLKGGGWFYNGIYNEKAVCDSGSPTICYGEIN